MRQPLEAFTRVLSWTVAPTSGRHVSGEAGRIPVQRNTFYEAIRVRDKTEEAPTSGQMAAAPATSAPASPEAPIPVGLA